MPPEQIKHLSPWEEVSVDMIGPWKDIINKFEYLFRALICIDSTIWLPDVVPVDNVTSLSVAQAVDDNWYSRYPVPLRYLHDNGNMFLFVRYGTGTFIKKKRMLLLTISYFIYIYTI